MDLLYNLFVVGLQQIHNKSNKWSLSINTHIKTAEQRTIIQQYREWYTGR